MNWKLRLSVADEGVEGGSSSLGVGMFEWGRTWKKHIRYIIMDFLSGVFTLTSKTQHGQHHFKQTINEKNIQYRMIAVTKFSIGMNQLICIKLMLNY